MATEETGILPAERSSNMNVKNLRLVSRITLALAATSFISGCNTNSGAYTEKEMYVQPFTEMLQFHGQIAWDQSSVIQYTTSQKVMGMTIESTTELYPHTWEITETYTSPFSCTIHESGGLVEIPVGELPDNMNAEDMINRWAYIYTAPFVLPEIGGQQYLGPVTIDGRPYDAVLVTPDESSQCPCNWYLAYVTAQGNDVGSGHLAMLRYPVPEGMPGMEGYTEQVVVYDPLTVESTPYGDLILPAHVNVYPWNGNYDDNGAEGAPVTDQPFAEVDFTFISAS